MRKLYVAICMCFMMLISGCMHRDNLKFPTDKSQYLDEGNWKGFSVPASYIPEQAGKETQEIDMKVGFMFLGLTTDYGFTYAQNQGRLALMNELGVETMVIENVPEDERCLDVLQELVDSGCTVIFSCSFGFMDYVVQFAEQHPQIYFFHCSGYEVRDNLSVYFGRMYQIRYLTGIVAGLKTQTDQIGYVAAFPTPEVIRGVDGFALGVKRVNPNATVNVKWSYTWHDAALERELAAELLNQGCDVMAQHQDTVSTQVAAEEAGCFSIGYHSPMGFFAKHAYLTGAVWNWGPYMIEQVKQIADGTWESDNYWGGIEDGVVMLDELTDKVAPGTEEAIEKVMLEFEQGFDVFEGPIFDNQGSLRVAEGYVLSDDEKMSMDWLVDNIKVKE